MAIAVVALRNSRPERLYFKNRQGVDGDEHDTKFLLDAFVLIAIRLRIYRQL